MRNVKPKDATVDFTEAALADAIRDVTNAFRRHRLNYFQTQYVVRRARAALGIAKVAPAKRLPKTLSDAEVAAFFEAVRRAGNGQHLLAFQALWATGLRVSEFVHLTRDDIDLDSRTIMVRQGKGAKDRVVPLPEQLSLALRLHLESNRQQRYVFETSRNSHYSVRYLQHLARQYGEAAGIEGMHPHRFRHTILTSLTRSKLTDAQIQLISGHASKKSLEVYQSIALRDVQDDYQRAMDEAIRRTRGG